MTKCQKVEFAAGRICTDISIRIAQNKRILLSVELLQLLVPRCDSAGRKCGHEAVWQKESFGTVSLEPEYNNLTGLTHLQTSTFSHVLFAVPPSHPFIPPSRAELRAKPFILRITR
jgi:hypothetical protein